MATTNATATSGFRLRRWQALTTPSCGRDAGMMLDGARKFMNEASGITFVMIRCTCQYYGAGRLACRTDAVLSVANGDAQAVQQQLAFSRGDAHRNCLCGDSQGLRTASFPSSQRKIRGCA